MTVWIVDACLRDGAGGSPTTVTDDEDLPLTELPERYGTSHVALIGGDRLRFFTSAGELPSCGHGTVAALAVLGGLGEHSFVRPRPDGCVEAWFRQGPVTLREFGPAAGFLDALGLGPGDLAGPVVAASPGRERLLVPVRADLLHRLAPDPEHLTALSQEHDQLGCFVYAPVHHGRTSARMFAPAIGVPEDVANANSTGCLAALLQGRVVVDQGDALGRPSAVLASAVPDGVTWVGGHARVRS